MGIHCVYLEEKSSVLHYPPYTCELVRSESKVFCSDPSLKSEWLVDCILG